MTDSPEAVLRRYFDAFSRHALPEMLELLHEEVLVFYPASAAELEGQAGGRGVAKG